MTESPELIETIISNPEIRKVAEEFWKDIGRLLGYAQEGKGEEIVEYIKMNKEKISQNVDLEKSYKKFIERVGKNGKWLSTPWDEIKKVQKIRLEKEHRSMYGDK